MEYVIALICLVSMLASYLFGVYIGNKPPREIDHGLKYPAKNVKEWNQMYGKNEKNIWGK